MTTGALTSKVGARPSVWDQVCELMGDIDPLDEETTDDAAASLQPELQLPLTGQVDPPSRSSR